MNEPVGLGAKAALLVLGPIATSIRQQWKRRRARSVAGQVAAPNAAAFEEALDTLSRDPFKLEAAIVQLSKRALSAVPAEFRDDDVRLWLQRDEVRASLVDAARTSLIGQDYNGQREALTSSFATVLPDSTWSPGEIVDLAVAFQCLTVDAQLTAGDRSIIDLSAYQHGQVKDEFQRLHDTIAQSASQPTDAANAFVERLVLREERLRSLVDTDRIDRLTALANRVLNGDLRATGDAARVALFQMTAAAGARENRFDDAETWIVRAAEAGATDLAPDRARVALGRGDYDRAIALIGDRRDTLSVLLVADCLKRREGPAKGADYLLRHTDPKALSGFGLVSLADWLARTGQWVEAETHLASATDAQLHENPLLPYARMRTRLTLMLADKFRLEFFENDQGLPHPNQLRDDEEGLRLRTAAVDDLALVCQALSELEPDRLEWLEAQQLYLKLLDRKAADFASAAEETRSRAETPQSALLFAPIAELFDIAFDHAVVDQELARREALGGGLKSHDLLAAFSLIVNRGDPAELVGFIGQHQAALIAAGAPSKQIIGVRLEALAKAGRVSEAREQLEAAREELGDAGARLAAIIAEIEDQAPAVAQWRAAFEASGHDVDLVNLVDALTRSSDRDLGARALELWQRRHRLDDILNACNALFNEGRDGELDALLAAVGASGDHDPRILKHRAWAAFRGGAHDDARGLVEALRRESPDDEGLRQLEINIAMETGRWRALGPLAHQDLERVDQRNAYQLLQAAEFAQIIDDPIAEELARAAVAKQPDDAAILLAAFGFAIRRGSDWGAEAGGWMRGAIQHSGSDGPVQQASLRELLAGTDDRQEQMQRLDRMILDGEIPLELVVEPLGITLSELFLERLPGNLEQRDARRRLCLPLVAGNRLPVLLPEFEIIAFDLPALLVLERLDLLEAALNAFPKVLLPAGTMPQLFEDYIRAHRGQKSRFAQAERVQRLITDGHVETVKLPAQADEDLEELGLASDRSALYVHNYPIHKPGSLGEEALDVSHAHDRIVSPAGVIDALLVKGELDQSDADAAQLLLGSSRERWPDERPTDLQLSLLLDGVALNALELAGVLPRLIAGGVKLVVSDATARHVANEIQEWQRAQRPLQAIERVCDRLVSAAASGRLHYGGFRRDGATTDRSERLDRSPLTALLSDASEYDALFSGDRMMNRHNEITDRHGNKRLIYTIVDVVDHLLGARVIDQAGRHRIRRDMRELGVAFVPIEVAEIVEAAGQGDWSSGASRALRAIVTSVHLPLLRRALVLPDELHWLGQSLAALVIAIRHCWTELHHDVAPDAATWLLKAIPDARRCIGETPSEEGAAWAANQRIAMHATLAQPIGVPIERHEAYWQWHASLVAPQLGGRDADLRPRVADALIETIGNAGPFNTDDVIVDAVTVRHWLIQHVPPPLRAAALDDERLHAALELGSPSLTIAGHAFAAATVAAFCKAVLAGLPVPLIDDDGVIVADTGFLDENGDLIAEGDGKRLQFDFAGLLADDTAIRLRAWDQVERRATLPIAISGAWRAELEADALDADALSRLIGNLADTPQAWVRRARTGAGELTFEDLAEPAEQHYHVLFDVQSPAPLSDALAQTVETRKTQGNVVEAARWLAPLAIAVDFDIVGLTDALSDGKAAGLARRLVADGDLFSVIAGFAVAASRPEAAECIEVGTAILDDLMGAQGRLDGAAHDFSAVAMAVIGHADVTGVLRDAPLSHRRCALLAHTGFALRALRSLNIERPGFLEAARAFIGKPFDLAGVVERQAGRWWLREWLAPPALAGLARARLRALLRGVPEATRPAQWTALLNPDAATDLLEMVPGPVDEFGSGWVTQNFPVKILTQGLGRKKADAANAVLFNILMTLEMPDKLDVARSHVLKLIDRAEGSDLAWSVRLALMAASRWRDPDLADKALAAGMTALKATDWTLRVGADWALAAIAPIADPVERLRTLERHLSGLIDRELTTFDAVELVKFLDKLADLITDAPFLHALRTRALLAA